MARTRYRLHGLLGRTPMSAQDMESMHPVRPSPIRVHVDRRGGSVTAIDSCVAGLAIERWGCDKPNPIFLNTVD